MKNPALDLRKRYYSLLNNIDVNGDLIPMFEIKKPSTKPYILFNSLSLGNDGNDKKDFNNLVDIILEVHDSDSSTLTTGSSLRLLQICNAITSAILAKQAFDGFSSDFNIVWSNLFTYQSMPSEVTGDRVLYRSMLSFRHWIENL